MKPVAYKDFPQRLGCYPVAYISADFDHLVAVLGAPPAPLLRKIVDQLIDNTARRALFSLSNGAYGELVVHSYRPGHVELHLPIEQAGFAFEDDLQEVITHFTLAPHQVQRIEHGFTWLPNRNTERSTKRGAQGVHPPPKQHFTTDELEAYAAIQAQMRTPVQQEGNDRPTTTPITTSTAHASTALYPHVRTCTLSPQPTFAMSVQHEGESEPWLRGTVLHLWDNSITTDQPCLVWGIDPIKPGDIMAHVGETSECMLCTIRFSVEPRTGRLVGIEIPADRLINPIYCHALEANHLQGITFPAAPTQPDTALCVDLQYWLGAQSHTNTPHTNTPHTNALRKDAPHAYERNTRTHVAALVTPQRLHLEFGQAVKITTASNTQSTNQPTTQPPPQPHITWHPLAPSAWLGLSADGAIAGISLASTEIDFLCLVRGQIKSE